MKLIVKHILFEYFILAACGLQVTLGKHPQSPCPDVFSYHQDGDSWYGLITGRSSSYGDKIKTVVNTVYDGTLKNGDLGGIVRLTSDEELREVVAHGGAIRYRLNFNVYPLPRLAKIEFNGRVLCESLPKENLFNNETKVEQEHTAYPKGKPLMHSPIRRARTTAELIHPSGETFRPVTKRFRRMVQHLPIQYSAPAVNA